MHLGLTSSDVIDTAQAVQLKQSSTILLGDLAKVQKELKRLAIEHKNTLMMGRTHGVHAEPTTFGLKMALWWDEMRRQRHRMEEAKESISVGKISGAVGTYATVPPSIEERVCSYFDISPAPVSNQVVQRDRHAHFVTTLALIAASLEKFATDTV